MLKTESRIEKQVRKRKLREYRLLCRKRDGFISLLRKGKLCCMINPEVTLGFEGGLYSVKVCADCSSEFSKHMTSCERALQQAGGNFGVGCKREFDVEAKRTMCISVAEKFK